MPPRQEILIVDDRPENLMALERTLVGVDVALHRATTGEAALAATLERDFALAILDVQMPGMDGFELAELLRGDPKTKHMPIIFLTAASWEEEQIFKGYESGAVDYIVKPYNPAILVSKVNVLLEMQAQSAELRRHREQLAAVNRELEAFAYSVSHDLRAPLRAIEGFSQALLEDCLEKLNEQEQDYLGRISSEARRMAQLIDDLLTLSRVTRAEMSRERVRLDDLAREVVARLREADGARRVEVEIADGLVVEGDPRLLGQVIENLLGNAWKFTGRRPEAHIELGQTGEAFFVRDNGVGFDMKYAGKLFAPFQRLHGMTEFPGTGIGLSTVQRIVARHGGKVWCESQPGESTTFFFTLGEGQGGEA
jgi:signal transduction histidine kinase